MKKWWSHFRRLSALKCHARLRSSEPRNYTYIRIVRMNVTRCCSSSNLIPSEISGSGSGKETSSGSFLAAQHLEQTQQHYLQSSIYLSICALVRNRITSARPNPATILRKFPLRIGIYIYVRAPISQFLKKRGWLVCWLFDRSENGFAIVVLLS